LLRMSLDLLESILISLIRILEFSVYKVFTCLTKLISKGFILIFQIFI
jgi:hypothetical protein